MYHMINHVLADRIVSCCTVSYIVSYQIVLYHISDCFLIYILIVYHIILYIIISYHTLLYVILYHIVSHHILSYQHTVLYYIVLGTQDARLHWWQWFFHSCRYLRFLHLALWV